MLCLPLDVETMPGVGGGQVAGDQRIWAVGPAGRRWNAGDSKPGFYSQPALGSLFSWGGPRRTLPASGGGASGRPGRSGVCSHQAIWSRPGVHLHVWGCLLPAPGICVLPGRPGWQERVWRFSPSRGIWGWGCRSQEAVLLGPRMGARDGEQEERDPRCPTLWPRGAEVFSLCPLLPLQPDVWPRTHRRLWFLCGLLEDSISRRQTFPLLQTLQGGGGRGGGDAPEMGVPWVWSWT